MSTHRDLLGVLVVFATLLCSPVLAQTEECGSFVRPGEVAGLLLLEDSGIYEGPETLALGNLDVPLTFHVVRRSDGTGGLAQSRLNQAVIDANIAFASAGIAFFQCGETRFIDSDAFYFDIDTTAETNALRSTNPVPNTINVYFSPNVPYCGISSFTTSSVQGIVMNNGCTATSSNHSTFPHEIGHYFNLYHTHETAFGTECTSGSNCGSAGDLVCDTPADPRLGSGNVSTQCFYTGGGTGPCGGDPGYSPDPLNFMSYSRSNCRVRFSTQQDNRARSTLVNLRPGLLSGCTPPNLVSIAPGSGFLRGGTAITLNGADFASNASVRFEGVTAEILQRIGSTSIVVATPPGASEGAVDVAVNQPSGSDVLAGAFTYTQNPVEISWTGSGVRGSNITIRVYGPANARVGLAVGAPGMIVKPCCTFCLDRPIDLAVRPSELMLGANGEAAVQWQVSGADFETKNIQGVVVVPGVGPVVTNCQSVTVFP